MNNTTLSYEIDNQVKADPLTELDAINQWNSKIQSAFKKHNRTPWDISALEGIKLKSALSALRNKDKELLALQNQIFNSDFK